MSGDHQPTLRLDLEPGDWARALVACLLPGPPDAAGTAIARHWPAPSLVCLTLRSAWDLYLGALALPPGSHVLMTAINHPDMAAIVAAHGLVPIPVDVDPQTMAPRPESLAKALSPAARILLVAHLFGGRVDLAPLGDLCRRHGLLLVEDCAQVFGGGYRGAAEADAAFFSFGPLKTASALGGGVALVRDAGVLAAMRARQERYPRQGRAAFAGRIAKFAPLGTLLRRQWTMAVAAALLQRSGRRPTDVLRRLLRNVGSGFRIERFRLQPAAPLVRFLAWRLDQDRPSTGLRRRAGESLAEALGDIERPGAQALDHLHWLFPVVVAAPVATLDRLLAARLHGMFGLSNLAAILPPPGRPDLLPAEAVRITESAILLPLHAALGPQAIARMAQVLHGDPLAGEVPSGVARVE